MVQAVMVQAMTDKATGLKRGVQNRGYLNPGLAIPAIPGVLRLVFGSSYD
jgi:hypothetical protein